MAAPVEASIAAAIRSVYFFTETNGAEGNDGNNDFTLLLALIKLIWFVDLIG